MLVLALPEEAQLSGGSFQNVTEQVGAFLACLFWLLFPLPNHDSIPQLIRCLLFLFQNSCMDILYFQVFCYFLNDY